MNFGDPRWLWGLIAIPVLLALEWHAVTRADRALERLTGSRDGGVLLSQRRAGQRRLSAALRLVALAIVLFGAADPEWGRELVRRGATGSDLVSVIDVSASMDVRDVAPSRLEEARREALAVIDRVEGSRVGVVAFAGDAVRLCPLTLDRSAARLSIEGLTSGSVSEPGTDLGRALRLAAKLMPSGRREEQAIVVWTDGEDLEHGAQAAIDEIARTGIRVFAVGVGTSGGDIVPVLDDQGRAVDVKRDDSGGPVRSRLDEALLRSLAGRTRGAYFGASRPGGELPRLLAAISTVAHSGRGERLVERPVSRFPLCALVAALLLLLDRVRRRRVVDPQSQASAARERRAAAAARARKGSAAAVLMLCLASTRTAHAQSEWARADHAFRAQRWADAESLYVARLKHGQPRGAQVDLATVRGEQGQHDRAESDLTRLSGENDAPGRAAGYNLGTLLGQRKDYDEALAEFRRALERDPGDRDARWNYEITMKQKQAEQAKHEKPKPQGSSGGGTPPPQPGGSPGSKGTPQKGPPQSSPGTPPPSPEERQQTPGQPGVMDKTQADQILNALDEQARLQQGQKRARVMRERHGRDW
jgi:Ca-activated chloride channel homolog